MDETTPQHITPGQNGWTVGTYAIYMEAMRAADERFHAERDRRYAEISTEREKALKIKEKADQAALELAREIQIYKDEKANELREQINSERGLYPTKEELRRVEEKFEAAIKPLFESIALSTGNRLGIGQFWGVLTIVASLSLGFGIFIHSLLSSK